jgi:hypothetical protein
VCAFASCLRNFYGRIYATTLFNENKKKQQKTKTKQLNWAGYTGVDGGWGALALHQSPHSWAVTLKMAVMLFPAVNMLSVFPLLAVTLGDALSSALFVAPTAVPVVTSDASASIDVDVDVDVDVGVASSHASSSTAVTSSWPLLNRLHLSRPQVKTLTRMLACVPPLIGSAFLGDVSVIFTVTGLLAIPLQLLIPCGFQLLSIAYCDKRWGADSSITPYSMGVLSSLPVVRAATVISVALFALTAIVTVKPDFFA